MMMATLAATNSILSTCRIRRPRESGGSSASSAKGIGVGIGGNAEAAIGAGAGMPAGRGAGGGAAMLGVGGSIGSAIIALFFFLNGHLNHPASDFGGFTGFSR